MASIDYKQLLADCFSVAKSELGNSWNSFKPYAEHEFKQFAENAEFLAKLKLAGEITDEELKARLEIQRLALKNVMLTIEGIGLIAAQNVVNAVLGVIGKAIQTAIGIIL